MTGTPISLEVDAILFDNDGVLVDSHAEVTEAWTQMANEFDLDGEELLKTAVGVRAIDTLSRYLEEPKLSAAYNRLADLEIALATRTRMLAGAETLLKSLPDSTWTVVTSAPRTLALARWAGAGITVPDQTVTGDDVSAGKPDPEPYLVGAKLLGVDPERCLVFEDSPSGGDAARAAGATVIAVGDQEWRFEPAARVDDLREVRGEALANGGLRLHIEHR